ADAPPKSTADTSVRRDRGDEKPTPADVPPKSTADTSVPTDRGDEKLTPADAQAVLVFNVRQALDSPLAKKRGSADTIKNAIEGNAEAKEILNDLGLDVTRDINTVSLAIGNVKELNGPKPEKLLVTVRGTFDPDRIEAAAEKSAKIKSSKEGIFTLYEIK